MKRFCQLMAGFPTSVGLLATPTAFLFMLAPTREPTSAAPGILDFAMALSGNLNPRIGRFRRSRGAMKRAEYSKVRRGIRIFNPHANPA